MSSQSHQPTRLANYWSIAILLTLFILMASVYSIVNPLHEATDELRHYRFVRIIATTGHLPVQGEEDCRSQSHHPPLVYALGALGTAWIDTGRDICYTPPENPFWAYRYWDVGRDNKNQYLHGSDERFPWSGEALAAHIIRFINVVIGAGVVLLTWLTGRSIWPDRQGIALGAAGIVAFNPMFLYMAGSINNDVIAALSGAAITYACVLTLIKPERLSWRWGALLGFLFSLALMSKFNLAACIVLIETTVIWAAWNFPLSNRHPSDSEENEVDKKTRTGVRIRLWFTVNLTLVIVTALLAGWWFVRNYLLYGEPTGFEQVTELWGVRNPFESFGLAISELPYAWTTLWGRFGFGQIPLPEVIYSALFIVTMAGFIGGIFGYFRNSKAMEKRILIFLSGTVLLFFLVLFNYMLVSPAGPNGRFFFPALAAFGLLLFYGLYQLSLGLRNWRNRLREAPTSFPSNQAGSDSLDRHLALITNSMMLLLAIVILLGYLAPAYAEPAKIADGTFIPNPIDANFDNLITLLGFEISDPTVKPGDPIDLKLYWEVTNQPPGNYLLFIHLLDDNQTMVTQRDTHPGLGNFPSEKWRPGDRFIESIRLYLPETAYSPATATISIGLYAPNAYRLAVFDTNGEMIGDALGLSPIEIVPHESDFPNSLDQNFNNELKLVGYEYDRRQVEAGDQLAVTLYWQALEEIHRDYTVQLRLVDESGKKWAKADSRPGNSDTATNLWQPGQHMTDTHTLTIDEDLPPGRYHIVLSLIDKNEGFRPSIIADDGHLIDTHLNLAQVLVTNENDMRN